MPLRSLLPSLLCSHSFEPYLDHGGYGMFAKCDHCGATKHRTFWTDFEEFNNWVADGLMRPSLPTDHDHLTPAMTRQY